jgi:hypothetical protein
LATGTGTDFSAFWYHSIFVISNPILRIMEDDDSIQCPVCKGEGIDLDGFVCWKCKGDGQIIHVSTSKDSTDTNINIFTLWNHANQNILYLSSAQSLLLAYKIEDEQPYLNYNFIRNISIQLLEQIGSLYFRFSCLL